MTLDKNGNQIQCGDIVRVCGAYTKRHNCLYWVEQDGTNGAYSGDGLTMKKICESGKISTAKYNLAFWPLENFRTDRVKNLEAAAHNKKHATIEIVVGINNQYIVEEIRKRMDEDIRQIEYWEGRFCSDYISNNRKSLMYWRKAYRRLMGEDYGRLIPYTRENFDTEKAMVGELVHESVVDDFMNALPTASFTNERAQLGEPHSHEYDSDTGKYLPTFLTFRRYDENSWEYRGYCFRGKVDAVC